MFGLAAYGLWGLFPIYWPLLEPASAPELLAHRIVWSLVLMAILVLGLRRLPALREVLADRRMMTLLSVAALALSGNWVTYIWAVNNGRVVESSLGYFINPLVTMLLGIVFLGERLRPMQWAALGVGVAAVTVLTMDYGRLPWVALVLAFSFGTYGLVKKQAGAGPVEALTVESALVFPIAVGFLAWLAARGTGHFATEGLGHALLLTSTGVVTVVPLVLFGAAANRVPMVTLGLMQYLTPVMQFSLGVAWFGEEMSPGRWAGFALVWLALMIFTAESLRHRRSELKAAADSTAF